MPNSLPKLPALRAELKKLCRYGDVRVSMTNGKLLATTGLMIGKELEAALAAYGYEWIGPRLADGEPNPRLAIFGRSDRYQYAYFEPASEPASEPEHTVEAAAECSHCDGTGEDGPLQGDECWWCFGTGEADNVRRYVRTYTASSSGGYPAFTSKAKTSADAPLKLDEVPLGLPGKLYVGFAPGKHQAGRWARDLDVDLDALRHAEVTHVLCLVEDFELEMLKMRDYAEKCAERGILLHRLPIKDGGIGKLDAVFTTALSMLWLLEKGENVYVHCKGGLGRAGTLAACILLLAADESEDDRSAIAAVRAARSPRAVENKRQEQFIADFYNTYAGGR